MNNMNRIFEMMNSHWGQLYQMFSNILDYLPGPHNQIFKEFDALKAFVSEEVKIHQASLDPSSPQDFIDCFLSKMQEEKDNPNSSFHMKNLITSAFDLFLAGTESTSTTVRYGLLLLLKYPKIQEKVQEEIDRVVGRSRKPCVADRPQMPYTDAVVHEIQRFISLIPLSLSEEYGPVFTVHLGSEPVVVLYGHDVVKEALIDRADEFAARGHMPIGDRANNGLGTFADWSSFQGAGKG
ncbi:cytochrome p450 2c19-like isoform x1 [Limosa lapponica baueri]|uniref:unspecific monooxygenase n=1 Tax=Limosa lapponica baueri TaxID=1758121 RepID=A0A2I0T5B9_LIMLA|nr:cytochrome p450 2c19-like isoform x1 [Limosa lapponica baueri]